MNKRNEIWLDTLEFSNLGGWKEDTQFVHIMGSGYLIAAGEPGIPVEDAEVEIKILELGLYRAWVRCRNWVPQFSPGRFKLSVNGVLSDKDLGAMPSNEWIWEIAGDFNLEQGRNLIALNDLTGYYGRCSSIIFTTDYNYFPPRTIDGIHSERARIKGLSTAILDRGEFEVIVVGGGPGGIPSAVAAARMGVKTLLIHNRHILGGNASTEAGVGFDGASSRQPNAREGGIAEEIRRIKEHEGISWTEALEIITSKEPNLTIDYNWHIIDAKTDGNSIITEVTALNVRTLEKYTCKGKVFIDCTGDGWLGYYACAKYRFGREARHEFDESMAPLQADTLTMSGCLMKGITEDTGSPIAYILPEWAHKLPEGDNLGRTIHGMHLHWWLETPNDYDDLWEGESARDELIKIWLGFFDYLKNSWDHKEKAVNHKLKHIGIFNARRESRRFIGDYILTQNDCMEGKSFEDTISHAGWPIDLHHPKGIFSGKEGPFFSNAHLPLVKIPFRCLYSVNINNLLFAGRDISVTHVALGTARVQNTIATMGQAAGTAAAMCIKYDITPRDIYSKRISELQQTLLKCDQYIPGLKNEDCLDLARNAEVHASSQSKSEICVLRLGKEGDLMPLDTTRAAFLPRGAEKYIQSIYIKLASQSDKSVEITMHLRKEADPDGYRSCTDIKSIKALIPPKSESWIEFKVDCDIDLRYLWVWFDKTEDIYWRSYNMVPLDWSRAEGGEFGRKWSTIMGQSHCVLLEKPEDLPANCSPENVINGYSRVIDAEHYAWVSDPEEQLPQWIELIYEQPILANNIYLTFDTDMNNPPMLRHAFKWVPTCAKDYEIHAFDGQKWTCLIAIKDNYLRRRIHKFDRQYIQKIKIIVTNTCGDKSARIFEVRMYNE